jgi:hypothetical protein
MIVKNRGPKVLEIDTSAWVTVRETIIGCLAPYPDALEALGRAMAGLEAADRDEERPRPDPAGVALRAANLLATVLGQNPEALEDDEPEALAT